MIRPSNAFPDRATVLREHVARADSERSYRYAVLIPTTGGRANLLIVDVAGHRGTTEIDVSVSGGGVAAGSGSQPRPSNRELAVTPEIFVKPPIRPWRFAAAARGPPSPSPRNLDMTSQQNFPPASTIKPLLPGGLTSMSRLPAAPSALQDRLFAGAANNAVIYDGEFRPLVPSASGHTPGDWAIRLLACGKRPLYDVVVPASAEVR